MSRAQEHPLVASSGGSLVAIARSLKLQTVIIAIPGVGTPLPEQWVDDSGELWFAAISEKNGDQGIGVFAYYHKIDANSFSWSKLLDHGSHLLKSLVDVIVEERLEHCPVIIVGHSVGGFIAKEASSELRPFREVESYTNCRQTLRQAYQQQHRQFIRSLAGVILLGTPHSTERTEAEWQNAALMVPPSGLKKRKGLLTPDDIESLVHSSILFEQSGIEIPILSIFEQRETKLKAGLIPGKRIKVLIAGEPFVRTGFSTETLLGIESDHVSLPILDTKASYFRDDVCLFFKTTLEDARLNIAKGSPTFQVPALIDLWSNEDRDEDKGKSVSDGNTSASDSKALTVTVTTSNTGLDSLLAFDVQPQSQPRRPRLPAFFVSVTKNRDFYGREEILRAIDMAFFDEEHHKGIETTDVKTFAICGPGGMGKTQIATEFAYSRQKRFDAVFWIRADSAMKVRDQFSRAALEMDLVKKDSVDARDQVIMWDLVRGWLANPLKDLENPDDTRDCANWLLILDNVDDVNVLDDFWPIHGPGCVIFTSRDPLVKNSRFLAADGVDLKPFSEDDSIRLMEKLTNKSGDSRAVHERLGGLPLAITQMAGVIIRRDLSFAEFVESYDEEEQRGELLRLHYSQLNQPHYKKTVWSVWALENLKHSGPLLEVISMLDPDGILEAMFNKIQDLDLPTELPRTSSDYQRARTELLQSSLISRDNQQKRMLVHRLIQDSARARLDQERFRAVWSSALRLVSAKWPYPVFGWGHSITRWRVCEELLPHVMKLHQHCSRLKWSRETVDTDLLFTRLLREAAWYHHERGLSIESLPLFQFAKSVSEKLKLLIEDMEPISDRSVQVNSIIAEIHYNFNCIACETNNPEDALTNGIIFNDIIRQQEGSDTQGSDKRLFISWNALGNGFMMKKMWAEGERCFNTSIASARLLKDFKPTEVSFPTVNLGYVFWLTGRYDESVKMFMEGLSDREAEFGVNDRVSFVTGRFLHGLGNVKWSQSLYDESFGFHQRALTHYEKTVGKNHHRTGDVHVRVADHYLRRREFDTAEKHLNGALSIFRRSDTYRCELARTMHRKSLVLDAKGEKLEAESLRTESARLYDKLVSGSERGEPDLVAEDFDEIVAFWSR